MAFEYVIFYALDGLGSKSKGMNWFQKEFAPYVSTIVSENFIKKGS